MIAPLLMHPEEAVELKEADRRTGVPVETLRNWYRKYKIGRRSLDGGRIYISLPAVSMIQHNDGAALAAYLAGDRSSPTVRRYFDFFGISIKDRV